MTMEATLESPPEPSVERPVTADSRRRRPSRRVVAWSAASFVIILIVVWQVVVAASASMVSIAADTRPLVCAKGQEVVQKLDGRYIELAKLTPALDCELRVHIYNGGAFPIHLDRATYDILGPDSRTAHADIIDGQPPKPTGDAIDATGTFQNGDLAPGQSFTVVAHITKARQTCQLDGGYLSFDGGTPHIQFTVLGTPSTRDPNDVHFGFAGTTQSTDPSC